VGEEGRAWWKEKEDTTKFTSTCCAYLTTRPMTQTETRLVHNTRLL
jgi:hypothetical protein